MKRKKIDYISGTETAYIRKQMPVYSGVLKYFPDAIREVAKVSWAGNELVV